MDAEYVRGETIVVMQEVLRVHPELADDFAAVLAERESKLVAARQGFDEQAARDELTNEELRETVIGLEAHAQQVGVTGVPFFIIDGKLAVSGAQTGDVWAQVFKQVLSDAA
jgi:predicted DsbA family dithiol-disulfide isomerase